MINTRIEWAKTREELIAEVTALGFPKELGEAIAKELGSPKAMNRMIGYLTKVKPKSAELIVDGKQLLFDTVAMKAIINGCSTSGDVKVKKADFYHVLQYSYGIVEDDRESYYEEHQSSYLTRVLPLKSQRKTS